MLHIKFNNKISLIILIICCLSIYSCQDVKKETKKEKTEQTFEVDNKMAEHLSQTYFGNLDNILKRKFFRVLTTSNAINYFVYQGKPKGFEYEMVKNFIGFLNKQHKLNKKNLMIQFEMIPVPYDQLIPMLLKGYGDMIAANITVTKKRQNEVAFTKPYNWVTEIVVAHESIQGLSTVEDLAGREVAVRESSSYYSSLERLNNFLTEKGLDKIRVIKVNEQISTESIIELVSMGKYHITIADSNIALLGVKIFDSVKAYPNIKLREEAPIAWAVNKKATTLLSIANQFIPKYQRGTLLGNVGLKKYFKNISRIKTQHFNSKNKVISPYDQILKKYGKKYGWDWRLLAAMAYQESRFRQDISNKWGAIGLFQIKKSTASEKYVGIPDIEGVNNADNNAHAGIKYLTWIKKRYFDVEDNIKEKDRIRMALAAYNAGPARILKARKNAIEKGYKNHKWFRNVEYSLLTDGFSEPVTYVSEINKRYLAYVLLGIE